VLEPLPPPQDVLFAATPVQTGADTAAGPVMVCESPPLVALAAPEDRQLVSLAATPAQTGAETATGPVTPVDPVPAYEFPAPAVLLVPQFVLLDATPAQIGADTATGPVTLFESPLDPEPAVALALLAAPQFVLFAATPAHTGADTATGPVTLAPPADPVSPTVVEPALPVDVAAPPFTPVLTEPEVAPWTTAVVSWVAVLALTVDPVETVAPVCKWAVVEVIPTGEVGLDGAPVDVPSARAAAP
jgi:hypothetical protein